MLIRMICLPRKTEFDLSSQLFTGEHRSLGKGQIKFLDPSVLQSDPIHAAFIHDVESIR